MRFDNKSVTMQVGEKAPLTLCSAADDEGFLAAVYSTSDSGIVSVSESGELTAVTEGTATVTGKTFNGKSADVTVTVRNNSGFTEQTTVVSATIRSEAGWRYPVLDMVPAGSKVKQYGASDDGRWLKVKYHDFYGWMYNKAFGDVTNYTEFNLETLPVMEDDLLFETGTDKRTIFDFVYSIPYGTEGDDATENLCVEYFRLGRGSCYHHAAMLCALYNRCGYETCRVNGISSYDGVSEHSWCISKTDEGWLHVDAQKFTIRTADEQFFIDDYSQFFQWDRSAFPPTGRAGASVATADTVTTSAE